MEGRNREVRRLLGVSGLKVSRLKRVRYGSVFIPSVIKAGQFRELPASEVKDLYSSAGLNYRPSKTYQQQKSQQHPGKRFSRGRR